MSAVTILVDNVPSGPLSGEWGLSMAVNTARGEFWLWDTGASDAFLANAARLGIDPGRATGLALSHGHYDHTGGIAALVSRTGFKGAVHAHPALNTPRYSRHGQNLDPVGIPARLDHFLPTEACTRLAPGLAMLSHIPRRPDLPQSIEGLFLDDEGKNPDPVEDDAFLVLETPRGPVVILGCCHSGLENSLAHMRDALGIDKIHALVGGLHLYKADEAMINRACQAIKEFGTELVCAGHCTGPAATAALALKLSCPVRPLQSGLRLDFS